MARIQVKTYRKMYLTRSKANYTCRSYYVYIPKRFAEPLVNKELRLLVLGKGIYIEALEPSAELSNVVLSEYQIEK